MTHVSTDIEDVILDHDKRGISALRPHLPAGYIDEAARVLVDNPGTALIVTGFYIMWADGPENDGPPGAVAMGNALRMLGNDVVYVSDRHSTSIVEGLVEDGSTVVDFPFMDDVGSAEFASGLLTETEPSVLISIERCGPSEDGKARNMRNADITEFNAKTDYLFTGVIPSVGIGDGGNEIGMGNLADVIPTVPTLVEMPCVTRVTKPVIASVSNWGGYGLVAALSRQAGRNLLPSIAGEREMVRRSVALGAVDSFSGDRIERVDGFSLEENSRTLERLHELISADSQ